MVAWQSYEEAALAVISDLRSDLGLRGVESKQKLHGVSGTEWEIDGKALLMDHDGFLIVEARRHISSGQKQEALAAVAYRINDLGAKGGVVVSPLPLQQGAQIIAKHENIAHIKLESWSTADNYLAQFMERNFHKASVGSTADATDRVEVTVYRKGKPVP